MLVGYAAMLAPVVFFLLYVSSEEKTCRILTAKLRYQYFGNDDRDVVTAIRESGSGGCGL